MSQEGGLKQVPQNAQTQDTAITHDTHTLQKKHDTTQHTQPKPHAGYKYEHSSLLPYRSSIFVWHDARSQQTGSRVPYMHNRNQLAAGHCSMTPCQLTPPPLVVPVVHAARSRLAAIGPVSINDSNRCWQHANTMIWHLPAEPSRMQIPH